MTSDNKILYVITGRNSVKTQKQKRSTSNIGIFSNIKIT